MKTPIILEIYTPNYGGEVPEFMYASQNIKHFWLCSSGVADFFGKKVTSNTRYFLKLSPKKFFGAVKVESKLQHMTTSITRADRPGDMWHLGFAATCALEELNLPETFYVRLVKRTKKA